MANDFGKIDARLTPGMCEYESKGNYLPVNEEHAAQIAAGEGSAADGYNASLRTTKRYECNYVCKDDNGDLVRTRGVSSDTFFVDSIEVAVCEGVTVAADANPNNVAQPRPSMRTSPVSRKAIGEVGPTSVALSRAVQRAIATGDASAIPALPNDIVNAASDRERRGLLELLLADPETDGALAAAERLIRSTSAETAGFMMRDAVARHGDVVAEWSQASEPIARAVQRGAVIEQLSQVNAAFAQLLVRALTDPASLTAGGVAAFVDLARDYEASRASLGEAGGYPVDALRSLAAKVEQVRPDLAAPLRELATP